MPILVKAEVKITGAELIKSSEGLNAEKRPTFKNLKINFDLQFKEKGDYVTYKLTLKNNTNKNYEIDTKDQYSEGEFIKYSLKFENNSLGVIKANEEKILYVTATYNKYVPYDKFKDDKYLDNKTMVIELYNKEKQENPNTSMGYFILVIAIIMFTSLILVLYNKYQMDKMMNHIMVLLIAFAIALPLTIYAIERLTIEINTNIEILSNYQEVHFLECYRGPLHTDTVDDYRVTDNIFIATKTTTLRDVVNKPDFGNLNPTFKDLKWEWEYSSLKTPKEFYDKYIGGDFSNYLGLGHYPLPSFKEYQRYECKWIKNVHEGEAASWFSIPLSKLKEALIASLKDETVVWFAADVRAECLRKEGLMGKDLIRVDELLGISFPLTKGERLLYRTSTCCHAMTFTGVNLDEKGLPNKWKIENSWGKDNGKDGYYVSDDAWFDEYVYEIWVDKKYVDPEIVKKYEESKAEEIEPFNPVTLIMK